MILEDFIPFIDYTSLNEYETESSISDFIQSALILENKIGPVAGVCTYSVYSEFLAKTLGDSNIKSVVVIGGFPHAQIPLEIKLAEIEYTKSIGIDELDIVISKHLLHQNKLTLLEEELRTMKKKAGETTLKVIIETGNITDIDLLKDCVKVCCASGVDFIKTSTGKISEGADPTKFEIICKEINTIQNNSDPKIGLKASGGIRTLENAMEYYSIVKDILGDEYLSPKYFRIGASSLLKPLF